MCVCVCVIEREREYHRVRKSKRERERERERAFQECVCCIPLALQGFLEQLDSCTETCSKLPTKPHSKSQLKTFGGRGGAISAPNSFSSETPGFGNIDIDSDKGDMREGIQM